MRPNIKRKRLGELFERQQTATVEEVVKAYHGEEELEAMMEKARKTARRQWAKEFKTKYGTSPVSFESAVKAWLKVLADSAVMQFSKGETKVQIISDPSHQFKAGIRVTSEAGEALMQELQPTCSYEESKWLIQSTIERNNKNWNKTLKAIDSSLRRRTQSFITAQNEMASAMFDFDFRPTGTFAK
jgi:hypothetical protein